MNYAQLIIIGLAVLAVFSIISALVTRYKRCPSDKLLVIYGRTGKKADGEISTARVLHGGGAFIWPVIQDYSFLSLTPIPIEINLTNALSKQNIRIDVPASFTVAISTTKGIMQNAAERLLGLDTQLIAKLAEDIIFGQMRLVIATMDIEEINADRDKFLDAIQSSLEPELQKIGLKLINVNVTDIRDESGYISALGKEAASKAINDAKISVAQTDRDGEVGSKEAMKEQRIKIAEADSEAQIGEANAAQLMRTSISAANAKAIDGENAAYVEIAKSTSEREIAEAEATRAATAAKNVKRAEADKESYKSQKEAEIARAEKDKATQYADIVVPSQIAKEKMIVDAEAEAEQIKTVAKGQADATFLKMEAEARGINEILTKTAEGYDKLVKAAGSANGAVQLILADKLETIIAKQVEAIKDVKIDKITVWDSGSGNNGGNGSTADFMQSFLKFVPGMDSAFEMVGAELPKFLQGAKKQEDGKIQAINEKLKDSNDATIELES